MSACLVRTPLQPATLGDIGSAGLIRLCKALGRSDLIEPALRVFEVMNHSWSRRLLQEPAWPSDLTDDATPFEFSLAFEQGRPEVRMLVEAQGSIPTAHEQWNAGRALSRQLTEEFGASCADLDRVADLFEPSKDSAMHFGLWHGVTFRPMNHPAEFKAYVNPLARGRSDAFRVVREALSRLDLRDSAAFLTSAEDACGGRALPVYFCLDMLQGETSRAKIYLAHEQTEWSDAERLLSRCHNLEPSDVTKWCSQIVGPDASFDKRPLLSCFSFTQGDQRPCGTLHIPARCYVENDQVLFERIMRLLDDVASECYESAVQALVARPLDTARGFQSYVSLRRAKGLPRVTVYLAPEVYALKK
jgi:DMATS type aromatic prenyltransferase